MNSILARVFNIISDKLSDKKSQIANDNIKSNLNYKKNSSTNRTICMPDQASLKGLQGEKKSQYSLGMAQFLLHEGILLSDIYIPKYNGESSQIDILFITKRGIFVFEVKNYSGFIVCDDENKYWTVCYPSGKRYKLYNPILQNRNHVKYLKQFIGEGVRCFSFIVFSDECRFNKYCVVNNEAFVVRNSQLTQMVLDLWNVAPDTLNQSEVEDIYRKLQPLTNVDYAVRQKHIDNINEKYSTTASICPRCGGKLKIRISKRGKNIGSKFMGCSNYPTCTFTKNV